MTTPAPTLVSSREACQILGISRSTLTYWILTDSLRPAHTLTSASGRATQHLFELEEVRRAAQSRTQPAASA